eukprot:scaffold8318_cov34-Prasinocladus_malaysianus.AAC.1
MASGVDYHEDSSAVCRSHAPPHLSSRGGGGLSSPQTCICMNKLRLAAQSSSFAGAEALLSTGVGAYLVASASRLWSSSYRYRQTTQSNTSSEGFKGPPEIKVEPQATTRTKKRRK